MAIDRSPHAARLTHRVLVAAMCAAVMSALPHPLPEQAFDSHINAMPPSSCSLAACSVSSVALVLLASIALAQNISTIAGTGDDGYNGDGIPATLAHLNEPDGVAVDAAGNVYIADFLNDRVLKVFSNGTITTFAGTGIWLQWGWHPRHAGST